MTYFGWRRLKKTMIFLMLKVNRVNKTSVYSYGRNNLNFTYI